MRVAAEVVLTGEQAAQLEAHRRGRRTAARLVLRARIVLLAAEGKQDMEIAALLGIVPRTAARWRARFLTSGVAGLEKDAPRGGRATVLTQQTVRRIVALTTQQKPAQATHWSTRSMAAAAGVSEASVRRVWRAHGLKPHRFDSFKLSNDPRFAEKLEDIIGLYLNPPEHALVLSLDEKSQIQALDRTQPGLPMKKGPRPDHDPRLQAPRNHHLIRRAQHSGRHRHGHLHAAPPPSGVAEVPAPDRLPDAVRQATSPDRR